MGYIQRALARRAIKKGARALSPAHQRCFAILLDSYTHERLESIRGAKASGGHSSVETSAEETHAVMVDTLNRLIDKYPIDDIVAELEELVRVRKAIRKQYDPEGIRYPVAHAMAPEDITAVAHLYLDAETPLTPEQKYVLTAVSFLTRMDETGIGYGSKTFHPALKPPDSTLSAHITLRILKDTGSDPVEYAQEYLTRMARGEALEQAFNDKDTVYYGNMCDYPDEFIDYLAKIKAEKNTHAWRDIKELTLDKNMTPERLRDLLQISEPFLGVRNLHYMRMVLLAVDSYPEMTRSATSGSPQHQARRESLFNVTMALWFNASGHRHVTNHRVNDERLISLIVSNPEHGDAVVAQITERQHYDFDQITAALELGTLGGGAL